VRNLRSDLVVPVDELEVPSKGSRTLRLLPMLLPAVIFLGVLAFGLLRSAPDTGAGSEAPQFDLPKLDGEGRISSSDLRGGPVVLNFWGSWCAPCREEAPLLERAWREYRGDGVVFLGVNIKDAESDARKFVEEFDMTYPVVRDTDLDLASDLGVYGLPETFFIDDEWRLLATSTAQQIGEEGNTVVLGAISEEQLRSNVEILIRRAAGNKGGAEP
jgi:cytochrome c biogenesis protein CcmG/thiol:disulfide interchange protein DsbE